MPDLPKKVGWIGLGIMGLPMLHNLLGKMEHGTQFYVYDVVQKSIDDIVEEGQGRVHACSSSKEVADLSVCCGIHRWKDVFYFENCQLLTHLM
jgi:3-hydroxyisobutyrate dehydrogenase